MNKKIWIGLATIIASIGGYIGYKTIIEDNNFSAWKNIVPPDAALVFQTNKPIKNWKTFSKSPLWQHLKQNKHLGYVTEYANYIDELITDNKRALSIVGDLPFVMSVHTTNSNDFDFMFAVNLGQLSKFDAVSAIIKKATKNSGYTHKKGNFQSFKFDEFYDKENNETLYLGYFNNFLVCSYNLEIFKNCISNFKSPVLGNTTEFVNIDHRTNDDGLLRTFINYEKMATFTHIFFKDIPGLSTMMSQLDFSGLDGNLKDNTLQFDGFTQIKDSTSGYFKSMWQSGRNSMEAYIILPENTAFMASINFDDFKAFYKNMLANYSKDQNSSDNYQKNIRKIEKYLGINVEEDMLGWIGTEICVAQIKQHVIIGGKVNKVIAIKTKNVKEANKSLDKLLKKIKRRTPIKFKTADYKGHSIKYMKIKGLFKSMFGKMFEGIDKPYFTTINEHIVFCDNIEVLLKMIDNYKGGNTLKNDKNFKENIRSFHSNSSIFTYINLNAFFPNLKGILDYDDWRNAKKNNQYIQCFPFIAMQFKSIDKGFDTKLQAKFDTSNMIDYTKSSLFQLPADKNKFTNDSLSEIDEFIIKNINKNTRKEFFESGKIKLLAEMKDDVYHGRYFEYHKNGMIKVKGKFRGGEKKGLWKIFDDRGKMTSKERFSLF